MRAAVFVDTNALYDYKDLDQIKWDELTKAELTRVILAQCVLREVQHHKDGQKGTYRSKRAESLLRQFYKWSEKSDANVLAFNNSTELMFDHNDPIVEPPLNPAVIDDQLIASILLYKTENPDDELFLVTGDMGMSLMIKAKSHRIQRLRLLDSDKTAIEEDPTLAENRKLKQQLVDSQNRLPKVSLVFENGTNRLEVPDYEPLTTEDVLYCMDAVKSQLPVLFGKAQPGYFGLLNANGRMLSQASINSYNGKLFVYYGTVQDQLHYNLEALDEMLSYVKVSFFAKNDGANVADGLDIDVRISGASNVVNASDLPDTPRFPEPPVMPEEQQNGLREGIMDPVARFANYTGPAGPSIYALDEFLSESILLPVLESDSGSVEISEEISGRDRAEVRRGSRYYVALKCDRVKHNTRVFLGSVYIKLSRGEMVQATPIEIKYEIRADNIPQLVNEKIVIFPVPSSDAGEALRVRLLSRFATAE